MAQRLHAEPADGRVIISCLVSDLRFTWQLHPIGETTDIGVEVELPEHEAHRLPVQRHLVERSLANLANLVSIAAVAATN